MIEVYPNRYLLCLLPKNSYVCGLFPACISSRHYSYLHHLTAASSLVVPSLYAKSALLSISLCFLFHSFPPLCQLFLLPFYLMISSLPCMFLDDTLLLEYPLPLTRPFFHLGLLTATSTHPVSSCFCIPLSVLSGQFHILLFNSLFRVLFQFSFTVLVRYRSDHLALFSVRCHLPPASLFSYNTPKLYYSQADPQYYSVNHIVYLRDFHSLWCCFPSNFGKHTIVDIAFLCLPTNYNSSSIIVWNPILILHYCCLSFSLAVTMDISFDFFFLR